MISDMVIDARIFVSVWGFWMGKNETLQDMKIQSNLL
jgi:hypothetical protein